ncbi:hypothetical protein EC973_004517 [Apophysomyces ossiformis]|uniref:FCH domain-containing protein n=1 Tax=Apophysomyces ossiformis TaxID=679940 RepID=A0A8H7BG00_9FUNG|nr:hypothetical protein EC973_004517 [Apophysomyces ossiformis]
MRDAKLVCEIVKQAYEERALLEEEYAKRLCKIASMFKVPSSENGRIGESLVCIQHDFNEVAQHHLQLSHGLKDQLASPLGDLLHKQKQLRKELQNDIQRLYKSRQLQARDRYNAECAKANDMIQKSQAKDRRSQYMRANSTIQNLYNAYQEAIKELEIVSGQWNDAWSDTCNALETMRSTAKDIDAVQELDFFVKENGSSNVVPNANDYLNFYIQCGHHRKYDAMNKRAESSSNYEQEPLSDKEAQTEQKDQEAENTSGQLSKATSTIREGTIHSQVELPLRVEILDNKQETPVFTIARMEIWEDEEEEDDDDDGDSQSKFSSTSSYKPNPAELEMVQGVEWDDVSNNERTDFHHDGLSDRDQPTLNSGYAADEHGTRHNDVATVNLMDKASMMPSDKEYHDLYAHTPMSAEDPICNTIQQTTTRPQYVAQLDTVGNKLDDSMMKTVGLEKEEAEYAASLNQQLDKTQSCHRNNSDDVKQDSVSGVHEELENMLRQLESQSRLSARNPTRVKLSGTRLRKRGPSFSTISSSNLHTTPTSNESIKFFDPFSTLSSSIGQGSTVSRSSMSSNGKWTAQEANTMMNLNGQIQHDNTPLLSLKPKRDPRRKFIDYGK